MQLDDFYQGGAWLRRWHIDGRGQPACWPPVEVAATAQADIDAIVAANSAVRSAIGDVAAYEAAARVRAGEQPDRDETYIDEDGEEATRWSAVYHEWFDAGRLMENAEPETIALFDLRADPPENVDPVPDTFEPATVAPSVADVVAERDRRLSLGFDYDFGDERGVHRIGTTEADMLAWDREVTPFANALVGTGDTESTITIVTDTGPATITGVEWLGILMFAGTVRQPIWAGYFMLIGSGDIPADYTDNRFWS